jgi:hypothetical protein
MGSARAGRTSDDGKVARQHNIAESPERWLLDLIIARSAGGT